MLGVNELDERSLWENKIVERLLLTITVADPQQLDQKRKPLIYTKAFVEIYNKRSRGLVHKTHRIIELEKYSISNAENILNLGGQQFYRIAEVLQSAYVVPRDTKSNTFHLNNYND